MTILGISDVTGNHSHSSIALLQDGTLTFALSQERLSRIKNDCRFPLQAIQTALEFTGIKLNEIDCFACGYPPPNYYGSLLSHSLLDMPRSLASVLVHAPLRLLKYLAPNIRKGLFDPRNTNGLFALGIDPDKFQFIDHHRAHVAAAYYSSGFDECLGISYGGFAPHSSGQNVAGAVYRCRNNEIEFLQDIPMPATGCYYSGVGIALGYKYMEQEGQVTALSAHGDPQMCYDAVNRLSTRFLQDRWVAYPFWIDYIMSPRQEVFLNTRSGRKLTRLCHDHGPANVAAACQKVWEENVCSLIQHLQKKYGIDRFALAGGVFNNIRINRHVADLVGSSNIFIHPFPGDGSTTIGAMLEAHKILTGQSIRLKNLDMGLGVEFSDAQVKDELAGYGFKIVFSKPKDICRSAAQALAHGKVIGWFQGREEYGPMALGHRCILGDPRSKTAAERINTIKRREPDYPLGASCLSEHGATCFQDFAPTPFMNLPFLVKKAQAGQIPGAVHIDNSVRVQAVGEQADPSFRRIVEYFYNLTGIPLILNSSLNFHGQPMVHRPSQAIDLLLDSDLDELVINGYLVKKTNT
jgi:carbamoyltransferase